MNYDLLKFAENTLKRRYNFFIFRLYGCKAPKPHQAKQLSPYSRTVTVPVSLYRAGPWYYFFTRCATT